MQTNETTTKQTIISVAVFNLRDSGQIWVNKNHVFAFFDPETKYLCSLEVQVEHFSNNYSFVPRCNNDDYPLVGSYGYINDGTYVRVLSVNK